MAEDPKITKAEQQLAAMPREYQELAAWCWNELRPRLIMLYEAFGVSRPNAMIAAAQLSGRVAKWVYGEAQRLRAVEGPRRGN